MIVVKLLVDGRNVETFQRLTVPESGAIVATTTGNYEVLRESMRRSEPFGNLGHVMQVAYLEARRPVAPSLPVPKAPARPTVATGLPIVYSVRRVDDIPEMIRPSACAGCGEAHGKVNGDYAAVLLDRGILCDSCATDRVPELAKMLDYFDVYSIYPGRSAIEVSTTKKISTAEMIAEMRELADAIELKLCDEKAAA